MEKDKVELTHWPIKQFKKESATVVGEESTRRGKAVKITYYMDDPQKLNEFIIIEYLSHRKSTVVLFEIF